MLRKGSSRRVLSNYAACNFKETKVERRTFDLKKSSQFSPRFRITRCKRNFESSQRQCVSSRSKIKRALLCTSHPFGCMHPPISARLFSKAAYRSSGTSVTLSYVWPIRKFRRNTKRYEVNAALELNTLYFYHIKLGKSEFVN